MSRWNIIASRQWIIAIIWKIIASRRVILLADGGYSEQTGVSMGCVVRAASRRLSMSMSDGFAACLQAARLLHKVLNQTVQILIINDFRLVQASRLER